MAEDLYTRNLCGETPAWEAPGGVVLRELRVGEERRLYSVYADAFSSRPGALLSDEAWTSKWPKHPLCIPRLSTVAEVEGAQVGYVLAYLEPNDSEEGYVGQVGVRLAERRKGVGAGMMLRTLRMFADEGLMRAALRVARDNSSAIDLYRKLGFSLRV